MSFNPEIQLLLDDTVLGENILVKIFHRVLRVTLSMLEDLHFDEAAEGRKQKFQQISLRETYRNEQLSNNLLSSMLREQIGISRKRQYSSSFGDLLSFGNKARINGIVVEFRFKRSAICSESAKVEGIAVNK